ncbi:hypothetical protein [Crocosphaera sp.]|uniref:hypothetical protein n=1 Tax=Crocosphaera sp. TaxID=2729996 RepID=UPI003F1EC67F|nr:hypothetical protein [Crocosphaera sp.]
MNNLIVNETLMKLAQEYDFLGRLSQLSESQQKRLVEILEIAESDDNFSEMLNKIDQTLAEELNLIDNNSLGEYEGQRMNIRKTLVSKLPQEYRLLLED